MPDISPYNPDYQTLLQRQEKRREQNRDAARRLQARRRQLVVDLQTKIGDEVGTTPDSERT